LVSAERLHRFKYHPVISIFEGPPGKRLARFPGLAVGSDVTKKEGATAKTGKVKKQSPKAGKILALGSKVKVTTTAGRALKNALREHEPDADWAGELRELRKSVGPPVDPWRG
jgi:hypothetical protein